MAENKLKMAPEVEKPSLDPVIDLCREQMAAVNAIIRERLSSDVVLVNQLGHHIIDSGGKRLRPMLCLLSAMANGYQGKSHQLLAAIIEFIHTATLLHDDVVDESDLRRGNETANALFGNAASVLVGDFLYSRAFEMMVDVNNMRVMEILANTTNVIAEGEVMQLMNVHDADVSEERYLQVIHCKTAKLFEAATRLGAVISHRDHETEEAMASYGRHLGMAFQLIDDVMDYSSNSDNMGKNVGDDLAEGKPTLPLIIALQKGDASQAALIRKAIEEGGYDLIAEVQAVIHQTGALVYTESLAMQEAEKAIAQLKYLENTEYKNALEQLALFSVQRTS